MHVLHPDSLLHITQVTGDQQHICASRRELKRRGDGRSDQRPKMLVRNSSSIPGELVHKAIALQNAGSQHKIKKRREKQILVLLHSWRHRWS